MKTFNVFLWLMTTIEEVTRPRCWSALIKGKWKVVVPLHSLFLFNFENCVNNSAATAQQNIELKRTHRAFVHKSFFIFVIEMKFKSRFYCHNKSKWMRWVISHLDDHWDWMLWTAYAHKGNVIETGSIFRVSCAAHVFVLWEQSARLMNATIYLPRRR